MLDFEEIQEILNELRIGESQIDGNLFFDENLENVTQESSVERGESNGR